MGKTKKIIKAIGISTAIVLSNSTLTIAEDLGYSNEESELKSSIDVGAKKAQVMLSAKALPKSIGISNFGYDTEYLANKSVNMATTPVPIAQASEAAPEISEPAQEPIPDVQKLNPNPNPLSFPTKPEEVEVDAEQPITLEQAIELAVKNNRDVQVSRLNVQRAEQALRQARAALFPTLAFDTNLTYSNAGFLDSVNEQIIENTREDNPGITEEQARQNLEQSRGFNLQTADSSSLQFGTNLTLTYNVYTGGQRGAQIRRAEKQLSNNTLDLERIVEQIRLDTATSYYNLQNSDSRVNIEEAAIADAQQTLKDAELLEQAGLGTRFEVLQAEVELANVEQRLTRALADRDTARRQLAETLSVGQTVDLRTADAIEKAGDWDLSLPETIVQAYKNRAELEQFLIQREIDDEERKIALAAVRPTVALQAQYGFSDDFEDSADITDSYSIGANIQWNFFDGGAAKAAAQQEDTDKEIAEVQFANQQNEVRFEVEQSFFDLKASDKNIVTTEKAVDVAEESLRLARLRFQAGVGTQSDVIDAQTSLTTARGNLLTAIIEYNQSYAQLQRAVTNLPDGGLSDAP